MKRNIVFLCPSESFTEKTAARLAKKGGFLYADIVRRVEQETGCSSEEILRKAGKRYLLKRRNETLRSFGEFEGILFLLPDGELRTKKNLRFLGATCFLVYFRGSERTEPCECDAAVDVCGKTPSVLATEIYRLWKKQEGEK